MLTPRGARSLAAALAAVLIGLLAAQAWGAARIKTATFDEPAHIGAGLSYLKTGEFKVNLQHPPLLKEIAALPLALRGATWPVPDDVWRGMGNNPNPYFQWQLGSEVLFGHGADLVLFWTRLPMVLLTLLLAWTVWTWGRRMLGEKAALGALLLFALDPTLVAHGALVTTDVGFALFATLFLYALWHYLQHRTLQRLLWCGLALGGALGSKFSAVFLLPIAALLMTAAIRTLPAAVPARGSHLADPFASPSAGQRAVWSVYALAAAALVAAVVIHVLYFFPSNPFLYIEGLRRVNADHDASYWPYMAGEFRPRFLSYYLVAYLLKEPIPSLVLTGIGVGTLLLRRAGSSLDRAFLLVPPALLFAAYTLLSDNLGFRYLIPALPFLHLAGGVGFATLLTGGRRWGTWVAAGLCVWLVVAAAGIYPDHLSYFNEAACVLSEPGRLGADGGTRCGPFWLDDSNVDWGQGLKQLEAWLRDHPADGPVRLAYFGSVRPALYGVDLPAIGVEELAHRPPPGRYVLSAHFVARTLGTLRSRHADGPGNWLLHARPAAVVGHAFYVYDLR
jgi:hypothetical protein